MIEREMKMMLTESEYMKTLKMLSEKYGDEVSSILQINYYFDDEQLSLFNKGQTLRIRQIEDKLKLEYKSKKKEFNSIFKSEEKSIDMKEFKYSIDLKKELFVGGINNTYKYIGNLFTYRINYKIFDAIVSIDKNLYLGKVDYEIEIEANSTDSIVYVKKMLDLKFEKSKFGKYKRFVKQYNNIMKNA